MIICDRQEILKQIFYKDKKIYIEKINEWKKNGISDLSTFKIIDCIYQKPKNIIELINCIKTEPYLFICNSQFIRSRNFKSINKNTIALTIIDECHCISGAAGMLRIPSQPPR